MSPSHSHFCGYAHCAVPHHVVAGGVVVAGAETGQTLLIQEDTEGVEDVTST